MFEVTPLSEVIEKHIDRIGLPQMLELIAIICDEKEQHIRANWQDNGLANVWATMSRRLDKLAVDAKAGGIK